jgi:hypothetical protein
MARCAVACRGGRRPVRAAEGILVANSFAPEGDLDVPSGFAKNGDTITGRDLIREHRQWSCDPAEPREITLA